MPDIIETNDAPNNQVGDYLVQPGDRFLGRIDPADDIDFVQTFLATGFGYYAVINGDGTATSLTSNRMFLLDDAGTEIARSGNQDRTVGTVSVSPTSDGTFYLAADPFSGATGSYEITLEQEIANSAFLTQSNVAVGGRAGSAIDYADDIDFFEITLESGFGYYAVINGDGTATSLTSNRMFLLDDAGTEIARSGNQDRTVGTVSVSPTSDGTFYLAADPFSGATGSYEITLEQEIANSAFLTQSNVAVGGRAGSAIDYADDIDFFEITLESGFGYYAVINGNGTATSLTSNRMFLIDDAGTEIARSGNQDRTVGTVSVSPASDGTFYLAADPFSGATGSYEITLEQEIANTFDTTENLKFGISEIGQYNYSTDVDMFRATLTEGVEYSVFLGGSSEPDSIDRGQVVIFDAQGSVVASGTAISALRVDYTPDATGAFFISVGSDSSFGRAGSYELRVDAGNLQGTAFNDVISGSSAAERIAGDSGNDTLTGGLGDDILDGGSGIDTAVFAGNQASYTLTLSPTATTLSDRKAGGDGTDRLTSIELLDFETEIDLFNAPMNLDIFDGPTGLSATDFEAIIELYIAYYNRAPDAIGLNYWGTDFSNGFTLPQMAENFFGQPETQAAYASLLNPQGELETGNRVKVEAFATEVYLNVLGRDPDLDGLNYWIDELQNNPFITPDIFILAIINGAKDPGNPTAQTALDQEYLATKADLGAYFAVIKGMSDLDDAAASLALFNAMDIAGSRDATIAAIDQHYADALDPVTGDFLMPLVGVIDDPFALI